jgi:hypothetical protein
LAAILRHPNLAPPASWPAEEHPFPDGLDLIQDGHHFVCRNWLSMCKQVISEFARLSQIHQQSPGLAVLETRSEEAVDGFGRSLGNEQNVFCRVGADVWIFISRSAASLSSCAEVSL